jgi:hypothetical protein
VRVLHARRGSHILVQNQCRFARSDAETGLAGKRKPQNGARKSRANAFARCAPWLVTDGQRAQSDPLAKSLPTLLGNFSKNERTSYSVERM